MNPLDKLVLALKGMNPKALGQKIAVNAVDPMRELIADNLTKGVSPEGQPWLPTKEGGRAYRNAAAKLSVTSSGDVVIATIEGPEAFAQKGTVSHPIRQMLPDAGAEIPSDVAKVIENAIRGTIEDLFK